jgi:AcrR family transcriptional regulator
MTSRQNDKRFLRTRAWIVQAFNELLFKRGYAALGTHFISKRAGVGRSTFYEHFHNKEELLLHSASSILTVLADAVTDAGDIDRIRGVVDHVLDQKAMAQSVLAGSTGSAMTGKLAELIEERLSNCYTAHRRVLVVPVRLASRQVAEAQSGLLRSWLGDESRCSSTALAIAIHRSSRALVASLECGLQTFSSQTGPLPRTLKP